MFAEAIHSHYYFTEDILVHFEDCYLGVKANVTVSLHRLGVS